MFRVDNPECHSLLYVFMVWTLCSTSPSLANDTIDGSAPAVRIETGRENKQKLLGAQDVKPLLALSSSFGQASSNFLGFPDTVAIVLKSQVKPGAGYGDKLPDSSTKSTPAAISAAGRIELCDDKPFHVHAMLPGRIYQDNTDIGKYFLRGEVLATMESAELVRQSADYLMRLEQIEMSIRKSESLGRLARADLERIQKLLEEGIIAEKELRQAEENVRTIAEDLEDLNEQRIRLENESRALTKMYGIKSLDVKQDAVPSMLPLKAPNSGVVIVKTVSLGDRVNPDEAAYVMANIRKVNLIINLPVSQLGRVTLGQEVRFSQQQVSRKSYSGRIHSITSNGPSYQDFSVKVVLENPKALLRPGMTGRATISVK
ncbi:MAG: efflux RND transporter periplasmic adaptor subunit [Candidatus Obscuribacterales bacterium]|nr:efflux RND transporter periplasmic adaptor subunit [Candidatus Obscuribacterales bacterium]